MIRLSELKLPLSALPVHPPRAADAPAETDTDRALPPHPIQALTTLAAKQLSIPEKSLSSLTVFKRSFDARKSALQAVFIVDVQLHDASQAQALDRKSTRLNSSHSQQSRMPSSA